MSDRAILSNEEQQKLDIIKATIQKKITNGQAAKMLCISPRQVKRLKKAIRTQGDKAIIHKLKRRKSNHCIDSSIKENLLKKIKDAYHDFKPCFAAEKLQEQYGADVTSQTIRVWMTEEGLWKPHKQKKQENIYLGDQGKNTSERWSNLTGHTIIGLKTIKHLS